DPMIRSPDASIPSLSKKPLQLTGRRRIAQSLWENSDAEAAGVFDLVVGDSNRHEKPVESPQDLNVGRLVLAAGEAVALRKADRILGAELIVRGKTGDRGIDLPDVAQAKEICQVRIALHG